MEDKNMTELMQEIKSVNGNVENILVPLLKDTISDYRKIVFRLIILIALLIVGIVGVSIYSINRYDKFLSNFEYSDEYIQDFDTGDFGDIVNATIQPKD